MKLGMKIGLGYGAVLAIMAGIGGLAIWNMLAVKAKSDIMANEYATAVDLETAISDNYREARIDLRTYTLAEDPKAYDKAAQSLSKLDSLIKETKALANKGQHLLLLRSKIEEIDSKVQTYLDLIKQLKVETDVRAGLRVKIAVSGKKCLDGVIWLKERQQEALLKDIADKAGDDKLIERGKKVDMASEAIKCLSDIDVAIWKFQTNAVGRNEGMSKLKEYADNVDKSFKFLDDTVVLPEHKQKVAESKAAFDEYVKASAALKEAFDKSEVIVRKCGEVAAPLVVLVDECANAAVKAVNDAAQDGVKSMRLAILVVSIGLAVALVVGVLISWFLSGSITRPVKAVAAGMDRLATGDLTVNVDADIKDEIGDMARAMNRTIGDLRLIMSDIRAAADQTAASGEELSATAENISSGSQQQASAVEEISASVETLTATIQSVAESAKQASGVADSTKDTASQGSETVGKSIKGMRLINESSEKISKIIGVISQIASQTNLLALNAAIEAASAGEHGLGFAVVADEVRKLAERSSQAAEEITQLIKESTLRVNDGSKLSDEVGKSLSAIMGGIEKTGVAMSAIRSSTAEQAGTASEVAKGMENISAVTEENSGSAEEMSASAEELAAQAQKLQELVSKFKLDDNGQAGGQSVGRSQAPRAEPVRKQATERKGAPRPGRPALPNGDETKQTADGALYHV